MSAPGVAARQLAVDALVRIDSGGAYANLTLPPMLERSGLSDRDRAFVTELVYGTTRMQRSCDWLVDRFLPDPGRVDATARAWLRLGAFQLAFLDTPPHAAVGATVESAPKKLKGLCNAVLRKVSGSLPVEWPDDAVRVSQPDWIVNRLITDLGHDPAIAALEEMNRPAAVTMRDDGYVQDLGSQWVAEAVGAAPGDRVLDVCAAPGGKATYMAGRGATVVAADARAGRVGPSPATPPRSTSAPTASSRWPPTAPLRRSVRARSTRCCSTPPVPGSVPSAAGPTPAGASSPTTSTTSRSCRSAC